METLQLSISKQLAQGGLVDNLKSQFNKVLLLMLNV